MAMFSVNTHRFDPYRNFKFRVRWDGQVIPAVCRVSPLVRSAEVVESREGGDPSTIRRSPGITKFEPITLERGLSHDTAFEEWANLAFNIQGDAAMSLANFRKDITIDFLNLQGVPVLSFRVFRCWVSEFQALPELDASGNAIAIQTLKLENEGWERDYDVAEPAEPSYSEPA